MRFPSVNEIKSAVASFEVRTRIFLGILLLIFIVAGGIALWTANQRLLVKVARPGGSLTEGIVGIPSFVNPLLAMSDADRDLTILIYSGLLRSDEAGRPIPDLAQSYDVSADGKIYTFNLKSGLTWQDGVTITSDDVIFTINKALDPVVKSPKRANWDGVKVEKLGPYQIRFTLKQPYAGFLTNMTMGILPKHLWQNIPSDSFYLSKYNTESVGSGPYKISQINRDSSGVPTSYELTPFANFALGTPKISKLTFKFYPSDDQARLAYEKGEINSLSAISPAIAKKLNTGNRHIDSIPLPRTFAVFLNQNQAPIFANKEVRQALDLATPREALIKQILNGYGEALTGPIPTGAFGYQENKITYDPKQAEVILAKAGWKMGKSGHLEKKVGKKVLALEFSLATSNVPELKLTAELLAQEWNKLGAGVTVRVYESGGLNQNIIKPRKFDALLFGEVVGREPDPFSFWHSSQRNYPGLNIAQYANLKVDKLLSDARATIDPTKREKLYASFQTELAKDSPAIFLYSPYFLYALPDKIYGAKFIPLNTPAERFLNIYRWYFNSEKIWKIFSNPNDITN